MKKENDQLPILSDLNAIIPNYEEIFLEKCFSW